MLKRPGKIWGGMLGQACSWLRLHPFAPELLSLGYPLVAAMGLHNEGNTLLSPIVVSAVGKTNHALLGFRVKTSLSQEQTGGHIAKACRPVLEGVLLCCRKGK